MQPTVRRIRAGISNSYLVKQEGIILVDSGVSGSSKTILNALSQMCDDPEQLRLIILTHGHDDHIGATNEIVECTGAQVALHRLDVQWLNRGEGVPAPPVTRWARALEPLINFPPIASRMAATPIEVNVILGDDEVSLLPYGVAGRVLHTPGHTEGSVSIMLEDGRAFVGDMVMNGFPSLRFRPGFPIVAQDKHRLARSWQKLLEAGATLVHPGHGTPFHVARMQDSL
jgi:glyoxylase-like metal-dependent hydrolase (beta-lactamase superfamily II)